MHHAHIVKRIKSRGGYLTITHYSLFLLFVSVYENLNIYPKSEGDKNGGLMVTYAKSSPLWAALESNLGNEEELCSTH